MQEASKSAMYATLRNQVAGEPFSIHAPVKESKAGGLRTLGNWKDDRDDLPLVSVITVVKNGAANISETILSVVHQSYSNIEYIVLDGGSEDGTADIIMQYDKFIDLWVSQPDKGIYDAMNKGLGLARGRYVHFLNADDHYLHHNVIRNLVDEFLRGSYRWIYGDIVFLDKDSGRSWIRYSHNNRYHYLFKGMPQQAFIFERKLYDEAGIFDTRYKTVADLDFLLRVMLRDKVPGKYFPSPFVVFSTGGISGDMSKKKSEREEVIRKYYPKWVFIFLYNSFFKFVLTDKDQRNRPRSFSARIYRWFFGKR